MHSYYFLPFPVGLHDRFVSETEVAGLKILSNEPTGETFLEANFSFSFFLSFSIYPSI